MRIVAAIAVETAAAIAVETAAVAAAAGTVVGAIADPAISLTTLSSGLRIVSEHVPGALSVSAGVWVGVGARDEPQTICGVSHFLEHLLFKGTHRRSAREIATTVDRVGGDMNAFTAKEFTAYVCRVPAAHVELSLDVLGDVISMPALRDADVESERQVILEELAMDEDTPDDTAYRLFSAALFPQHPLGRETAGEVDTVRSIKPDDVRDFFGLNYRAGNMVLALAGPVGHADVVAFAEQHFGALSAGKAEFERERPSDTVEAVAGEQRDCEQVHLLVGCRALERTDPGREALDMVMHALGGGPSSRLFQTIREERGLTYSTYASASAYADAGLVGAYAATNPETAAEVLGLLEAEINAVIRDGITDDELAIAKGYLTGAFAMGFEGTGSRSERLGSSFTNYGHIRPVDEQVARWQAVSLADTRNVIERVFVNPRVRCAVGPVDLKSLLA